ncbi:aldehyde dehydrogenase family protein [Streptomyces xinghaiensis]|uniref:aldehyde dehydrogenase family protein n=1 Tax=Streptomyces xinghaiensis TaxID=1038928 RepID=UPI0002EFF672|nr:aldehyde dehydrogenase family protein [Streptomyces xinghaiensis]MZE76833.1 aldehyde dehydrogenase family protein [Streptomyces sp. SID5475]
MTSAPVQPAGDTLTWSVPYGGRADALRRVRDFLAREPGGVLDLLCEISTHRAAGYELEAAVATLDGALAEVERYRPGHVRSVAVFMPSNVLLYSYVLYLLVPSLYSGSVVFRPSSQVRDQVVRLHRMLAAHHRLPVELVTASQRAFVRDHARPASVVVFTGAYRNAERIREQLSTGQLFLHLGAGVNPFVVAPGADVERAAADAVEVRMLNAGQDCLGPDLFCVHEELLPGFLDELITRLKGLRYGPYHDPATDYGPIFYEGALEEAALFLARNRKDIVHGGAVDFRSRRFDPVVVHGEAVTPRTHVPEFFAPVFNVAGYRDESALAATLTTGSFTERALGASVYGTAPALVEALRRRTTVTTDTTLLSVDDGNAPFGGYGRQANYISDGENVHAEPVLISKAVADHLPADAR